jgi:hypothetical protein
LTSDFPLNFNRLERNGWLAKVLLYRRLNKPEKVKINFQEENKMKKAMVTMTITAITIMTWASIVLACGGGGGL